MSRSSSPATCSSAMKPNMAASRRTSSGATERRRRAMGRAGMGGSSLDGRRDGNSAVGAARAQAREREVVEARDEAGRRADGGADVGGDARVDVGAGAATLADDELGGIGGGQVEPGAMADVQVAHDAGGLEDLEVAVDRRQGAPGAARGAAGDLLRGARAGTAEERLQHGATGAGEPQAA